MGRAANLIRLILAGVFLLAFAVPAPSADAEAASVLGRRFDTALPSRAEASFTAIAVAMPMAAVSDTASHPGPATSMPECCALGLCGGTVNAVLPAALLLGPLPGAAAVFTPLRAPPIPGIDASPASPPPRRSI